MWMWMRKRKENGRKREREKEKESKVYLEGKTLITARANDKEDGEKKKKRPK